MKENQLPKYFVVKRDDANPQWRKYIDWLNKIYLVDWPGFSLNYYGYDGSIIHKGTNAHDNIERFENSPTLLTLDEWLCRCSSGDGMFYSNQKTSGPTAIWKFVIPYNQRPF